MEFQANATNEQLQVLLWIAVPVISFLIGVVIYFLDRQFRASKALADLVNDLNLLVTALKTQLEIQLPVTEHRLNSHSDDIRKIRMRVKELETEHNLIHQNCKK